MSSSAEALRHFPRTPEVQASERSPVLLWFAGAFVAQEMGSPLVGALEDTDAFGPGNVRFESSILSWERRDNQRYEKAAEFTRATLTQGRELWIAAHSFGLRESVEVLKHAIEQDKDFLLEENLQNLHIVSVSGVGIHKGLLGQLQFWQRLGKLAKSIPFGPASVRRGIDSLPILPSAEIPEEELVADLRSILDARLCHHDEEFGAIKYPSDAAREIDTTEKRKRALFLADQKIQKALKNNDVGGLMEALKERGVVSGPILERLFLGDSALSQSEWSARREALGKLLNGAIRLDSVLDYFDLARLAPGIFNGECMRVLETLSQGGKGANIHIIHLEYDPIYRGDEIKTVAKRLHADVEEIFEDHHSFLGNPSRIKQAFKKLLQKTGRHKVMKEAV